METTNDNSALRLRVDFEIQDECLAIISVLPYSRGVCTKFDVDSKNTF